MTPGPAQKLTRYAYLSQKWFDSTLPGGIAECRDFMEFVAWGRPEWDMREVRTWAQWEASGELPAALRANAGVS